MIVSIIRLFVLGAIGMTIAFVILRLYLGSLLREEFEEAWAKRSAEDPTLNPDRDAWVDAQMQPELRRIRIRAFLFAYVMPTVAVTAIFFGINFL